MGPTRALGRVSCGSNPFAGEECPDVTSRDAAAGGGVTEFLLISCSPSCGLPKLGTGEFSRR